jgi:hypothetical protein
MQGESDAFTLQTATAYGIHFTAWLAATRAALAAYSPCVPLVMAVMSTRQREGAFPYIEVVAEQQRGLKLPRVLRVDMAGYEFYAQDGSFGASDKGWVLCVRGSNGTGGGGVQGGGHLTGRDSQRQQPHQVTLSEWLA